MKETILDVAATESDIRDFFTEYAKTGGVFEHRPLAGGRSPFQGAGVAVHIVDKRPVMKTRLYLPSTEAGQILKVPVRVFFEDAVALPAAYEYLRHNAERIGTIPEEVVLRLPLYPAVRTLRGVPTAVLEIRKETLTRVPETKIFRRLFEVRLLPEAKPGFFNDRHESSPRGIVEVQGSLNGSRAWRATRPLLTPQSWELASLRAGDSKQRIPKKDPLDELFFSELAERFLCLLPTKESRLDRERLATLRAKYLISKFDEFDKEISERSAKGVAQPPTFPKNLTDELEANLLPFFRSSVIPTPPPTPENPAPPITQDLDPDDCDV